MLSRTLVTTLLGAASVLTFQPAQASTEYQQVFAYCLQQSGGNMQLCHPWTRCILRNGVHMAPVCATTARNYLLTGWEQF